MQVVGYDQVGFVFGEVFQQFDFIVFVLGVELGFDEQLFE